MPNTRFDPRTHGFSFSNDFEDWVLGSLGMYGRCGGMVYAALDYYLAGLPIPVPTPPEELPAHGSVLSTYIWERQYTSVFNDVGDDFSGRQFGNWFGWETVNIFNSGLRAELTELVRDIDGGNPVPLGLVVPDGSPFAVGKNHQVLAIGYERRGDDDVTIKLYDPNYPRETAELVPNQREFRWIETAPGAAAKQWLTYFVNRDYEPEHPPASLEEITGKDWSGRDLTGMNLARGDYRKANFMNTRCYGADLHLADLSDSNCSNANFTGANLGRTNFSRAEAAGATFYGADLREAVLRETDLRSASLFGARMGRVTAGRVRLTDANLTGADLTLGKLPGASAERAVLVGAALRSADLSGAVLNHADLHGADLNEARLSQAAFQNADLHGANLYRSNLFLADLNKAFLYGADLRSCNLRGARLREADLHGADLRNVDATKADFTGSSCQGCDLRGANLSGAIGI